MLGDATSRLLVKVGRSYRLVRTAEIDCMEAEGNYLRIHLGERSYLIRRTLSAMESELDPRCFVRVNRSTLVNVERIKELRAVGPRRLEVVLEDDRSWGWSRRFRGNLARLVETGSGASMYKE